MLIEQIYVYTWSLMQKKCSKQFSYLINQILETALLPYSKK